MNRESDQPAAVGQDNNDAGASADIPASGTRKQEPDKPPVSPQPADARDAEIRQLVALLHDLKPEWDAMTRGRIWTADRAGYKASLRQRFDAALAANPQEGK